MESAPLVANVVRLPCSATRRSIVCPRCGRCRCRRCAGDNDHFDDVALPGVWCGARCGYCTPHRVADAVTCVCCVRAVAYHADEADLDVEFDVSPCSCSGGSCARRWACLAALAGVGCLPCLLLYWPLRAALSAARTLYSAAGRPRGCRCDASPARKYLTAVRCRFLQRIQQGNAERLTK